MTLFPAIIVFAILFLSFSKKTLSQPDDSQVLRRPQGNSMGNSANVVLDPNTELLKYELLKRGLERKAQRGKLAEY